MTATIEELHVDGNAAAGLFGELFAFDVTTAVATCAGCGRASPFGALTLYGQELGAVLRCPGCGAVMVVLTRPHGEWWLDLRGVQLMRIGPGPAPAPTG